MLEKGEKNLDFTSAETQLGKYIKKRKKNNHKMEREVKMANGIEREIKKYKKQNGDSAC